MSGDDYVTINGGQGDDTINVDTDNEVYIQYVNGDGNDVMINANGTIQLVDGSLYTRLIEGEDQLIRIGLGSIRVLGAANRTVKITGGAFRETMTVGGTNGADNLSNIRMYANVAGGDGDDTITNFAYYTSLSGGSGDDRIINAYSSSINGGLGDDLIELSVGPNIIEYTNGDGNDLIIGYDSTDTIRLVDGAEYSTVESGSDVIVSIGSGSIRLQNVVGTTINIVGGKASSVEHLDVHYFENTTASTLVTGTDEDDTIINGGTDVRVRATIILLTTTGARRSSAVRVLTRSAWEDRTRTSTRAQATTRSMHNTIS